MAGLSQTQNLSQQQVLAPQLQQSLQILQAPMLELRTLIQQELDGNPTLEMEDTEPKIEDKQREAEEFDAEFNRLSKLDEEWRDYMAQNASYSRRSAEEDERRQFFFDSLTEEQTLQQHLLEQLRGSDLSKEDTQLGELLIGNIDDTGFLTTAPADISKNTGLDAVDLERVLEMVQTFHPVGVGARDLRECLLIQLKRIGKEGSIEWKIVSNHLEDLGKKRFPEIARRCSTTVDCVQRASLFIATLDPKPGQIFTPDPNNYVLPDVMVEKIGGNWIISLNGDQIPHLRISNTYKDLMAQTGNKDEVRDYIRDKIRNGKFLIKSIHQRQQTISNIAHEIVKRQQEFLEQGPSGLKPMTMVQIADAVGVHETTVSRAISGKYMASPHGVFEMKYFFTPGYQTADGAAMSNTSVKGVIAELVAKEDPKNPLSDKEIVDMLKEKGIPIARRTVAKYRNELNILPSNMRKSFRREKAMRRALLASLVLLLPALAWADDQPDPVLLKRQVADGVPVDYAAFGQLIAKAKAAGVEETDTLLARLDASVLFGDLAALKKLLPEVEKARAEIIKRKGSTVEAREEVARSVKLAQKLATFADQRPSEVAQRTEMFRNYYYAQITLDYAQMLDAAVDQFAIEKNVKEGGAITWDQVRGYLKDNTQLAATGATVFGDKFGPFTCGAPVTIPAGTYAKLKNYLPVDAWGEHAPK